MVHLEADWFWRQIEVKYDPPQGLWELDRLLTTYLSAQDASLSHSDKTSFCIGCWRLKWDHEITHAKYLIILCAWLLLDKILFLGVPIVVQWKWIQFVSIRIQVQSLASLSGLRIQHCRELWCRSQTWLESHIAVSVMEASSCSSDSTLSLETSICWGCGPKKQKTTKQKKPHIISLLIICWF